MDNSIAKTCFILFFSVCNSILCANNVKQYDIKVRYIDDYTIKVDCFIEFDSLSNKIVEFYFGGLVNNLLFKSVKDLKVHEFIGTQDFKRVKYSYDSKNKRLKIKINKKFKLKNKLHISYIFYNLFSQATLSPAVLFEQSKNYYWHPELLGDMYTPYTMFLRYPGNFKIVSNLNEDSVSRQVNYCESYFSSLKQINHVNFSCFDTTYFYGVSQKEAANITIYYIKENINIEDSIRRKKTESIISECIDFFSERITNYPYENLYIIESNYFGSENLGGYLLLSSNHLYNYSLIHEITHTWCGDLLKVEDSTKGSYLLKESLNEYLVLLFLKYNIGEPKFDETLLNYKSTYCNFIDTVQSKLISIYDIDNYSYSTHYMIQKRGPLLFDYLANTIGQEKFESFLFSFIRENINKKISYQDFLTYLQECHIDKDIIMQFDKYVRSTECLIE